MRKSLAIPRLILPGEHRLPELPQIRGRLIDNGLVCRQGHDGDAGQQGFQLADGVFLRRRASEGELRRAGFGGSARSRIWMRSRIPR